MKPFTIRKATQPAKAAANGAASEDAADQQAKFGHPSGFGDR